MSKIKFRVWDRATKKMHVVGEDQHDSLYIHEDCTVSYYNLQNGCGSAGDENDKSDDGYDLMRFTGLPDKNGREIYEGDIIQWADWKGNIKRGPIKHDPEWNRFCVWLNGAESCGVNKHLSDSIEIIGNIHETPELPGGDER